MTSAEESFLERRRARRAKNRDVSILYGTIHDLQDQVFDLRFERDWWLEAAVDAQLEAESLKRSSPKRASSRRGG